MQIPNKNSDIFIRGIIPELNVRFLFANIQQTLKEIENLQPLSLQSKQLLGEVILGSFLLTSREIKQEDETIGIHIQGNGPVKKILSFAHSAGGVRGIIIPPDAEWKGELYEGKGEGILQVNKFKQFSKKIYSSTVEMRNVSFAKNLEEYIAKSEQINAFIKIHSICDFKEPHHIEISGYFFEALPEATFEQIDALSHFLHQADPIQFLKNIFGKLQNTPISQQSLQTFNAKILQSGSIFFRCDCNLEKIENVILSLGQKEVENIIREYNQVEITCEFCKKKYIFTENDIKRLFQQKE